MTDATYNVMKPDNGVPIKAWTKGVPLEDAARQQLLNVAQLPFIYKWVAAMPDVHWGIGATVGSVIPTRGAIIPAAVGVDIGCGMMAVQTSLHANHLPDNLHGIRTAIEKAVPHGRTDNGGKNDRGAWSDAPAHHAGRVGEDGAGVQGDRRQVSQAGPRAARESPGNAGHREPLHRGLPR